MPTRRRCRPANKPQDYDCFYASVVESEYPELREKPLAIQQKQIIVTCNYVARKRVRMHLEMCRNHLAYARQGLYKLQLITEAKKTCPDVVIVLGEDLTRFRDASKALYSFLRGFSWNDRAERLGFDEVWLDVSDIIDHNEEMLDKADPSRAFFHLSRTDPSSGFVFDGTRYAGCCHPETPFDENENECKALARRLILGSHLASYIREQLFIHRGYSATVGIATNKLLSKLVGNVNKPKNQTTLVPPYEATGHTTEGNVVPFMDRHEIGAVPGIGFKLAQKLREYVLNQAAEYDPLVFGKPKESISSGDLRTYPKISADLLERILAGPGSPRGIGSKVLELINGIDTSDVAPARNVPRQISIEDSYIKLDTLDQLKKEFASLTTRLLERMRLDLTETSKQGQQRWIGKPSSLRLSTRPRQPLQPDGTRVRSFKRLSRSAPMPVFVYQLGDKLEQQVIRLVSDHIMPLFRKLHPEKAGWNLSLVNVAATDIVDSSSDNTKAEGQNIQAMFQGRRSERASDESAELDSRLLRTTAVTADYEPATRNEESAVWESDSDGVSDESDGMYRCPTCSALVPAFASIAHQRFHDG